MVRYKLKKYIEIDVKDLDVKKGRDGVFVIPNNKPLDIKDRIIDYGDN